MKFLVVMPHKPNKCDMAKVLVTTADTILDNPFESWALDDGRKILFVTNSLHGLVKTFYVSGRYESGALYNCTYDELVAVVKSKIGPSDRERHEIALVGPAKTPHREGSHLSRERTLTLIHLFIETCTTILFVAWKAMSVVLFLPFAALIGLIIGKGK